MSYLLPTLTKKKEVDTMIRDTIDKVLVLRFGLAEDVDCHQLDDILDKNARKVSKFATVALVDIDSEDVQVYVKTADHTKWVLAFHEKQDFIDVVEAVATKVITAGNEFWIPTSTLILTSSLGVNLPYLTLQAIFRGAMKGKLIVHCPLPQNEYRDINCYTRMYKFLVLHTDPLKLRSVSLNPLTNDFSSNMVMKQRA
ncbi:thioredoxin-like protein 4B-like isoform X2 [Hibiscus syriacus]|uniref:Thioredoxin-like protein 4B-like isoform X2 n=1 Tax=Hibiscus syriacus TaxID=106335 RepID=A0A6A2YW52_HIBSY|nr:thioredoxin-like protein 4B-like isoform X2 [Hibiscus syriacus]